MNGLTTSRVPHKDHTFSAPKIFQFTTRNPSVQHLNQCVELRGFWCGTEGCVEVKDCWCGTERYVELRGMLNWGFFVWNWGILGLKRSGAFVSNWCVELRGCETEGTPWRPAGCPEIPVQSARGFFKAEKRSDASNEIVCLPCQLEKLVMILELALYVESSSANRLKLNTNLT